MNTAQRWLISVLSLVTFLLLVEAGGPAAQTAQAPVTLRAVTAWPKQWMVTNMFFEWVNLVNQRGEGRIKVEYRGGPETFPAFEQLDPPEPSTRFPQTSKRLSSTP